MRGVRKILSTCILLLICSGCCSARYTTTIKKQPDSRTYPVRFYIGNLKYNKMPAPPMAPWNQCYSVEAYAYKRGNIGCSEESVRKAIEKMSIMRYPHLFCSSDQDERGLPLSVSIYVNKRNNTLLWMFLGTYLVPLPVSERAMFHVMVHESKGGRITGDTSFTRKDTLWYSTLSPLGLIPVPGKTDRPKLSSIIFNGKVYAAGGDLTIEGIVDSVASILQQSDLTPEIEEYIKSQRQF